MRSVHSVANPPSDAPNSTISDAGVAGTSSPESAAKRNSARSESSEAIAVGSGTMYGWTNPDGSPQPFIPR
jgi:hypothetical protein